MNRQTFSLLAVIVVALLAGCARAPEPFRVRAADLGARAAPLDLAGRPIIVEFQEGDVIPIDLAVSSDIVELTPATPVMSLRARRRFFVRVSEGGVATSIDGVNFGGGRRGSFAFGIAVQRTGVRVKLGVQTPSHAAEGQ